MQSFTVCCLICNHFGAGEIAQQLSALDTPSED